MSISPSARPFSPSPPRENRHSVSRPPSLLFGAAPIGIAVPSTHFSLQGLPATPAPHDAPSEQDEISGLPKRQRSIDGGGINYFEWSSTNDQNPPSSGRQADGTVSGEFVRARPIPLRNRSDSESTTSSASPPLGATSLLAAFNSPANGSGSNSPTVPTPRTPTSSHSTRFPNPATSESSPRASTSSRNPDALALGKPVSTPTRYDLEPPSPRSMKSVSTISTQGLSNSKSLPRLHQPTVLRSVSGKGIVFVPPPPAHASPTATSFTNQPRPHRASLGRISAHGHIKATSAGSTAQSIADADAEHPRGRSLSQTRSESDSLSPATASTHLEHGDDIDGGHLHASSKVLDVQPTLEEDTALTPPADSHHVLPITPPPEREVRQNGLRHEIEPQGLRAADVEIANLHEVDERDEPQRKRGAQVPEEKEVAIPTPAPFETITANAKSGPGPITTEDESIDEPTNESKNDSHDQRQLDLSVDDDDQLHEVSYPKTSYDGTCTPFSEPNYDYVPPYAPRSRRPRPIDVNRANAPALTSQDGAPTRPETPGAFSVTLHATVTRASAALPLTHSRIEMDIFWGAVQRLKWVPGMSWIPGVHLHVVPGAPDQQGRGLVRTVVHTVVSGLPIVWRFANWV